MATPTQTRRLTADEFWELYGDKEEFADGLRLHYELINGRVADAIVPGFAHMVVQGRLTALLINFVTLHSLGQAGPELHSKLSAYSTLVPDVVFIGNEKLRQIFDPDKPLPFAPDLAVEIISPSNSNDEIQEKIDLYFAAGTQMVWLIYPKRQEIVVYRANGTWQAIKGDGILTGDDLLPGLSIPLADLFAPAVPPSQGNA